MKYPVVELNGFKYWKKEHGFARAYSDKGQRYYADDYPVSLAQGDIPTEPGDAEFIEMMKKQEK